MTSSHQPTPISIQISRELRHFAVSSRKFLDDNPSYNRLAVGAFIFSVNDAPSTSTHLLLLQRASNERAFPNCWEVPGGSAEQDDPTILHSVAREVFEETGLRLNRVVRQIGSGMEFNAGPSDNPELWVKLEFEIEVAGMANVLATTPQHHHCVASNCTPRNHDLSYASSYPQAIEITLDPVEHQAYKWVTEEEVKISGPAEGCLKLVSEDQRQVILQAFQMHEAGVQGIHDNLKSRASKHDFTAS